MTIYKNSAGEQVEAIKWDGGNLQECIDFLGDKYEGHQLEIIVTTEKGKRAVMQDNHLVKNSQGVISISSSDDFPTSYQSSS